MTDATPGPSPSAEPTLQAGDAAERLRRLWDEVRPPELNAFLDRASSLPPPASPPRGVGIKELR